MLRHRALSLSEILRSIFEHLDNNLLSVCARVCKAWTDEALDCLWYKLRSLHVLLRLLAPVVWDEESEQCFFCRRIEPADWAVFQKYNARVRVLSLFRDGLHASMYTLINLRRPPIVLLPNLHRFVGDADPHVVLTFCNESVYTLHLETADYEFETSIEILLQCIPIQMPNLVDLDLDLDFTTGISKPDLRVICDMFKNLPFLRILSVLASFLLPEATHILSKHQLLESLTAFPDTAVDATFATDLNPESFPLLKDLYLSITLPRANSCLSSQFAPKTLKTINIRSQPQGAEPVSGDEVDSLIKNIAHNWPAVESVNIDANHRTNVYELTYLSIKPLLSCTQLTSITLEWPHPPCLTDAEFVAIFKKLPFLKVLDIGHGDVNSHPPRMSMDSLISIAPYCPHLAHLSVFMSFHAPQDANQVPTCSTPLTALRTLDPRADGPMYRRDLNTLKAILQVLDNSKAVYRKVYSACEVSAHIGRVKVTGKDEHVATTKVILGTIQARYSSSHARV
ncbi:hypothetical protein ONZ45_g3473 [Pleurotus djamor]|nr:hypothetical protein ONZ45_g3473 [Pleurotus djamor]